METEQPEHAEVAPRVAGKPPARPADVRVRVGPLCLPSAAVAWGLSIAAHGALLGIGLAVVRSARPEAPPTIALARGDGGEDGGESGGQSGSFFVVPGGDALMASGVAALPGPPPPAPGEPVAAPPLVPEQDSEPEPVGDWLARSTLALPPAELDNPATGPVGLPPIGPDPSNDAGGREPTGARADGRDVGRTGTGTGKGQHAESATDKGVGGADARSGWGEGSAGVPGVPGGIADGSLPAPVYPRESRLRGEEGTVVVEVIVDADGTPARVRVVDDAGYPRLARAALAAMSKARFRPAAAAYRLTKPFKFTLRPGR